MREIIIDTETTGLSFKRGDRIIELACVELINHVYTGNNIQFYCRVEKQIEESAIKIHGITNDFLTTHPTFRESSEKFLNFIEKDKLIIHNAEFDIGFINNELGLINLKPIQNEVVDTVELARKTLNTRIANLDYLCKRFSIDLSERKLHGALLDCQLLAEVYLELLGGKQTAMELNEPKKEVNYETKKSDTNVDNFIGVKITKDEIRSHKNFIKSIKNALWEKLDY